MFTHENGPWHVDNGSMISNSTHCMLDEDISVCVSIDAIDNRLILHKVGKTSFIKEYYDTAVQRFIDIGLPEMANEWKLISFNVQYPEFNFTPEGYNFTIDEICTLINWWSNSPGSPGSEILTMPINDVKDKLKMLSSIGFQHNRGAELQSSVYHEVMFKMESKWLVWQYQILVFSQVHLQRS